MNELTNDKIYGHLFEWLWMWWGNPGIEFCGAAWKTPIVAWTDIGYYLLRLYFLFQYYGNTKASRQKQLKKTLVILLHRKIQRHFKRLEIIINFLLSPVWALRKRMEAHLYSFSVVLSMDEGNRIPSSGAIYSYGSELTAKLDPEVRAGNYLYVFIERYK